jgi:membrane-associated phospholipid phosphatase
MMQWLIDIDKKLFTFLNGSATASWLDAVAPWYRDSQTWIPLYVFLLLFVFINGKFKGVYWLIFIVACAGLTDQVSSQLLKKTVMRLRPCADPSMADTIRLLMPHCSGGYSFTSSHATNHFGAAAFVFITLKKYFQNWAYLFWFWAASISYLQIYVGVHYPLDVLVGALLGAAIGTGMAKLYQNQMKEQVV